MHSRIAMLAILVLAAAPAVAAPPVWGGLAPGPHGTGFRVLFESDPARAYFPATDSPEGSLVRPIQITLWYPARPGTGSAMRFGDYVEVAAGELGPDRDIVPGVSDGFRRGPMQPFFDGPPSDEAWARVLGIAVAAGREAVPAPGRFPLVLHAGGGGALTQKTFPTGRYCDSRSGGGSPRLRPLLQW